VLCCLGAFSIAGLATTAADLRKSGRNGSELVRAVGIASAVAEDARGGFVATLAPELVAGSNVRLDRRFVTGPFLFRTEGALAREALRLGYSPNWQSVQLVRTDMPSAIVLGTETEPRPPLHPQGLDWYLERWARGRNYSEHNLAGGVSVFLAPNLADRLGTVTRRQVGPTSAVTPWH
jgi:hypothetical protein